MWRRQHGDPTIMFAWTGASLVVSLRTLGCFMAHRLAKRILPGNSVLPTLTHIDMPSTSNSEIAAASRLGLNLYPVSIILSLNAYRINGIYNQKP